MRTCSIVCFYEELLRVMLSAIFPGRRGRWRAYSILWSLVELLRATLSIALLVEGGVVGGHV